MFPTASSTKPDRARCSLRHSQNGGPYPDSRLSTLVLRPLLGSPPLHKHSPPGNICFFNCTGNSTRSKDGKDG